MIVCIQRACCKHQTDRLIAAQMASRYRTGGSDVTSPGNGMCSTSSNSSNPIPDLNSEGAKLLCKRTNISKEDLALAYSINKAIRIVIKRQTVFIARFGY